MVTVHPHHRAEHPWHISFPRSSWAGGGSPKQSSKATGEDFLLQRVEELARRGDTLDLILTNKEGPVGNVKLKGSLGCSDREKSWKNARLQLPHSTALQAETELIRQRDTYNAARGLAGSNQRLSFPNCDPFSTLLLKKLKSN